MMNCFISAVTKQAEVNIYYTSSTYFYKFYTYLNMTLALFIDQFVWAEVKAAKNNGRNMETSIW